MTEIEDRMRPHLEAMWADRDRLVQQVTRAVTSQVPSYAVTPSSEVWIGMTRILERVAYGDPFAPPTEDDRVAAYGTGAQGARAGIAPEDLVAAVLLGAREVEADVLDRAAAAGLSAEQLLLASGLARRWAEQMAVWATQGLVGAARDHSERHVIEERLVLGLLQDAPRGVVLEQAAGLGVDPGRDWFAVVALGVADDDPAAATALRLATPGALWATVSDGAGQVELVGLVPRIPRVPDELVVGAAGPGTLFRATPMLRDAARAARVARRFGRRGASDLDALGLLVPLHEDPDLAARLTARWIAPLEAEPRHQLVATLRSWIAHDGQVELVAREFAVHANTVRNRLVRIGDILGPEWRTPPCRAEIWAALQVDE
ncbi:PucR family transcriptional regulator [Nocardioides marmoriginsengisoli]|uniref:PucR family transcriptional regulator n=1 Tax=Nocardioides marmoriginsengisoli TaxID=661483 RepID=A0A3N0CFY9_9ACTN|nr:helix-turn-helix domain-containing protein [Nocardioides marmoriginsengisoli]RNL62141.1 PucR family transcriptional regulator [Nocardioides marmoriginsengisoli]